MITLDESWFYLSTDYEQIWLRPDEEPSERVKHPIQDKKIMVTISWNALGFHLVDFFQRTGGLMQNTIVTISSRNSSGFAHRLAREISFFMQTMQALTLLKNIALFVPKMDCGSPHTRHTRPISRPQTSSSSIMLGIACKESELHHVRNYLQEFARTGREAAGDFTRCLRALN
jgi:hypothetical protein